MTVHGNYNTKDKTTKRSSRKSVEDYLTILAGVAGFEPARHGVKDRCLYRLAIPQYEVAQLKQSRCGETDLKFPAQLSCAT